MKLSVSLPDDARFQPLPATGEVTLGRSNEADVVVPDGSVSRVHLRVRVGADGSVKVCDLQSKNGTRVRGADLAPDEDVSVIVGDEVTPGDIIEMGAVVIMVQAVRSGASQRPARAPGAFEQRIAKAIAGVSERELPLAVLRLQLTDPSPQFESVLVDALGQGDVLDPAGADAWEVLLVGYSTERSEQWVKRVVDQGRKRGLVARAGLAQYPTDGRTAAALLATAREAVRARGAVGKVGVVVTDPGMLRLHKLIERVAQGTIPVMLLGETGVGKEVVAETVHRMSPRKDRPFLRLNCPALSESLLESELFGHVKGAFTGAAGNKQGLLESANGGTVFLDEVGDLPASVQVKLLRVLEERKVTRVGSLDPSDLDVRVVSATHRNLDAEIAKGSFRNDLFFRLNGIAVEIPPLRQRGVEVVPLARAFLTEGCRRAGRTVEPSLSHEAVECLQRYAWPGNIRELRNVMERAVLLCGDEPITAFHLRLGEGALRTAAPPPPPSLPPVPRPSQPEMAPVSVAPQHYEEPFAEVPPISPAAPMSMGDLRGQLDAYERQRILDALDQCGGNQTAAAKMLGIPRRTFIARLEQYNVPRPRKRIE